VWAADTEHWSAYLAIDWTFAENWKLTLEDRWVNEDFDLLKPNQSSCTSLGFAVGQAPFTKLEREVFVDGELVNDQKCLAAQVLDDPDIDPFGPSDSGGPTWRYIYGSESSEFHTPKVTLEWAPTDDALIYTYWAHAQKPGGINQLSPGGSAVLIDEERFKPEQLDAYELGAKTTWEIAGFLQLNAAMFFQDYTDKQIGTQILRPDEIGGLRSSPLIINAEGGEIWGLELETLWQPSFAEGLVLGLSYTYLDTEFTDFVDYSTSSSRSAFVGSCPVVWFNNQNEIIGRGPDIGPVLVANGLTDPSSIAAKCELNLTGNKFERTPEHSLVGTLNYTRPLLDTGAEWFTELNATWQDERFVDPENYILWDAYWLVDLRLGVATERVEVVAYVDNLFDDDTLRSGGSGPDFAQQVVELGFTAGLGVTQYFGALPDPRVLGVRMTYRFGAP